MQLGSLELQIFVALILVLGSAFVALVCDFLKGNNEQLREKNIELRVRQDERERMGLFEPLAHPIAWLQGLAALARNPGMAEAVAGPASQPVTRETPAPPAPAPSTEPAQETPDLANLTGASAAAVEGADDRNPQRRHRYDDFKATSKQQTWATKEELERLAGRAARIRARHEATHRKVEQQVAASAIVEAPAAAATTETKEGPRWAKVAELPKLELTRPVAPPSPAAQAPVESPQSSKVAASPALKTSTVPHREPEAEKPARATTVPTELVETKPEPVAKLSADEPVEVEVETQPVLLETTPPVAGTAAANAWVFRPAVDTETKHVAVDFGLPAAAQTEPPVVESPIRAAIQSGFKLEKEEAPVVEPLKQSAAEVRSALDSWLRPTELSVSVPAPEMASMAPPPIELVRTRIQPVEVVQSGEEVTEDINPPQAVASAAELAPRPEERPIETVLPALDVAALQKATAESRPAPPVRSAVAETVGEGKLEIPAGLHESPVLSELLESQTPYSGVVVAIGLNDYDTLREKLATGTDSVAALNKMVLSMLRPQDFACRFQDDEYILIYPGERGSSAQRRLFQVSEKLWDFQLRSLGNLSVMFSWGGLEVTNETLAEAVASARERMYQTKRNRRPTGLDFGAGRKKVVNG